MHKLIFTQALSKIALSFFQNLRHQKKRIQKPEFRHHGVYNIENQKLKHPTICTINKYVI